MVAAVVQEESLSVGNVGGNTWRGTAWSAPRKKRTSGRMRKASKINAFRWWGAATRHIYVISGRPVRYRVKWYWGGQWVHVASVPRQGLGGVRLWGTCTGGHAQRHWEGGAPRMAPPQWPVQGGPDRQTKNVAEHQEGADQRFYTHALQQRGQGRG